MRNTRISGRLRILCFNKYERSTLLISMSGIDSAGKSTQILNIVDHLQSQKRKVKVIWSRGGYTPIFSGIKTLLRILTKNSFPEPGESRKREITFDKKWIRVLWVNLALLDMIVFYSLYFRMLAYLGYTVIADRYLWDTYIDFKLKFQNEKQEGAIIWQVLEYFSPVPDISFILTIPVVESLDRSRKKKEPFSENLNQREKRLALYQDLIEQGKWSYIIDGMRPIGEVWSDIRNQLL